MINEKMLKSIIRLTPKDGLDTDEFFKEFPKDSPKTQQDLILLDKLKFITLQEGDNDYAYVVLVNDKAKHYFNN